MTDHTPHPREEEATAYALGLLQGAELHSFEAELRMDAELRSLVDDLLITTSALTLATEQQSPPPALKQKTLNAIAALPQEPIARKTTVLTAKPAPRSLAPWLAAAASVAIGSVLYWQEHQSAASAQAELAQAKAELAQKAGEASQLRNQLSQLQGDMQQLASVNQSAQMKIATLQATVDNYKQGVAVVVWNSNTQTGVLKLEKMPPVEVGRDYQLWVVDPAQKTPVNAGVVKVDAQGFANIDFKPVVEIKAADHFAISVEKEGGVPENKGPIVLLSP
jgi:anti-sigma-K factor RskA